MEITSKFYLLLLLTGRPNLLDRGTDAGGSAGRAARMHVLVTQSLAVLDL